MRPFVAESEQAFDPVARRLRAYLLNEAGRHDRPPGVMRVHAWINPDGTVERISFRSWRAHKPMRISKPF